MDLYSDDSRNVRFAHEQVMKRQVPEIIKQKGLDFSWDAESVWPLDVPTEMMSADELTWHFEIPYWSKPGGFYDLSVDEMLADKQVYSEHYERVLKADTSYPIDVMWQDDRWVILDGLHRLVKLVNEGRRDVAVRKIPRSMIPLIKK